MHTNINFVNPPSMAEHSLFGDIKKMIADINAGKHLCVDVTYHTKTLARISICVGNNAFDLNTDYPDCKFVLHRKEQHSFISSSKNISYYFKLNKKQNFNALLEQIKAALNHVFGEHIETMNVDVWETYQLKEIREKYS